MENRYIVETLDANNYEADDLTEYLNTVSDTQNLRLVTAYPTTRGNLTLIWELQDDDDEELEEEE